DLPSWSPAALPTMLKPPAWPSALAATVAGGVPALPYTTYTAPAPLPALGAPMTTSDSPSPFTSPPPVTALPNLSPAATPSLRNPVVPSRVPSPTVAVQVVRP